MCPPHNTLNPARESHLSETHVTYLSRSDVEATALPMADIIDAVEMSLKEKAHGRVQMPAKHWLEPHPERWFGGMSSLVPAIGYAAMKWQSGSSQNAAKGRPYLTGMLFLNSIEEGLIDVVMDSTWLTQQRTAAESAVAIKYLAKPGARAYTQLGCGVQGRSHFEAFRHVLPGLEEVVVFDINEHAAMAFAEHIRLSGYRAKVASSAREAVDATDIVVTAGVIAPNVKKTIDATWLHPGLLGVAIDYDCYWKTSALVSADRLVTDDRGQIDHIKPYGYFQDCPPISDELGEIVAAMKPGRQSDEDVIIACNMGVAVEDVATAKAIFESARRKNIGSELLR
jgi:ornithine cyclodeaminase/alanine dehydrogenase-like protein (mu-crystallin family)